MDYSHSILIKTSGIPICAWRNWGIERLRDLPEGHEHLVEEPGFWPRQCAFRPHTHSHHVAWLSLTACLALSYLHKTTVNPLQKDGKNPGQFVSHLFSLTLSYEFVNGSSVKLVWKTLVTKVGSFTALMPKTFNIISTFFATQMGPSYTPFPELI